MADHIQNTHYQLILGPVVAGLFGWYFYFTLNGKGRITNG